MQISLFQICIRDTFKIEISVFQLQIHVSAFKNKNRCLYLTQINLFEIQISLF